MNLRFYSLKSEMLFKTLKTQRLIHFLPIWSLAFSFISLGFFFFERDILNCCGFFESLKFYNLSETNMINHYPFNFSKLLAVRALHSSYDYILHFINISYASIVLTWWFYYF